MTEVFFLVPPEGDMWLSDDWTQPERTVTL